MAHHDTICIYPDNSTLQRPWHPRADHVPFLLGVETFDDIATHHSGDFTYFMPREGHLSLLNTPNYYGECAWAALTRERPPAAMIGPVVLAGRWNGHQASGLNSHHLRRISYALAAAHKTKATVVECDACRRHFPRELAGAQNGWCTECFTARNGRRPARNTRPVYPIAVG